MLAALCIAEPRRRWLSIKRRPPYVRSEFVSAGSGRFVKITAYAGKNGLDWAEIRHAAGREAGRLLLPSGVTPPENSRIFPFEGKELARKLMTSTGLKLLKTVAINPRLVQIAVYDAQAVMPDLPVPFLPYAADVKVVTRRPDRYIQQKYVAMERYGAVLTVTEDVQALKGSLLILAPDDLPEGHDLCLSARGLVLAVQSRGRQNEDAESKGLIDGYFPHAPRNIVETLPKGCDAEAFLAGLYELSGVKEIAEKTPEFLHMGGHTITLRDAAWRLAGIDIGISV